MENRAHKKLSPFIWVGLGLTLALMLLALLLGVLTVKSGRQVESHESAPVLGTVRPFSLTNQNGVVLTEQDLRGKVWIADIIFTRCAGPCLRMSEQMRKLQQALKSEPGVQLVSLTTDPDFDTPDVLKTYAARFDADPSRWMFLTGTKKQIGDLATGSLKLASIEKAAETRENPDDLFIHSTIFVVIDTQLRLRGIFETQGEGVDSAEAQARLLGLVHRLTNES